MIPIAKYNEILEDNKRLIKENLKLKSKVDQMRKEFMEMSHMVEAVIEDKSNGNVRQ